MSKLAAKHGKKLEPATKFFKTSYIANTFPRLFVNYLMSNTGMACYLFNKNKSLFGASCGGKLDLVTNVKDLNNKDKSYWLPPRFVFCLLHKVLLK